ncbi:hypothetical protein CKA27_15845 [Vibrio coralliilyticus]|nr:hypothetical protein [Vibrio coralliilyticus]PAT67314.1 hypothetical protein CKA27_15845 [Vibrio coralliilyticus]
MAFSLRSGIAKRSSHLNAALYIWRSKWKLSEQFMRKQLMTCLRKYSSLCLLVHYLRNSHR